MKPSTSATPCACGHEVHRHYNSRGVCLKTSCPCQNVRQSAASGDLSSGKRDARPAATT